MSIQSKAPSRDGAAGRTDNPSAHRDEGSVATPVATSTESGVGSRLRDLFGHSLRLRPVAGLEPDIEGPATWRVVDEDACFQLSWQSARWLAPGHYRITLKGLSAFDDVTAPSVWADTGLRQTGATAFRPAGSRAASAVSLLLPTGARDLFLDPGVKDRPFTCRSASLRRMTRVEYYVRLALGALNTRRGRGHSLSSAVSLVLRTMRHGGLQKLAADLRRVDQGGHFAAVDYRRWIDANDAFGPSERELMAQRLARITSRPRISVLMPVYNPPEDVLRAAVASVVDQVYDNWELCIADDRSTASHVAPLLRELAAADSRIKLVMRDVNGHISAASNSALQLASGEWIAMLDHDDLLAPNALAEVALAIDKHRDAEIVYSDEDKIAANGERYEPYFKPDFSRELLRSQNYINHLAAYRSATVRALGGWRAGFEGSQDFDLNLRMIEVVDPSSIHHIPKILYHWRAMDGSTALDSSEKSYAYLAGQRALEEHLQRIGMAAQVLEVPGTQLYRIRPSLAEPRPMVSIIIPTRDRVELIRNCISSIREKTTYTPYEIVILDNGSVELETAAYLSETTKDSAIRVLRNDGPFNFSALNNVAVREARGSVVALVNNDIEVISPDWLEEMVSWALQPDVGCVGAKLYYANDTVQHAGVILGIGGVAGHSHKHYPRYHDGYFSRLRTVQNLSAVTAACLVVRKGVYEEVGGLDADHLAIAFNDVDFCLKVRAAGYLNVWTPFAELYHLESVSRGAEDDPEKQRRFNAEAEVMLRRWALDRDPYYSPNLTLDREDFSLSSSRKRHTPGGS